MRSGYLLLFSALSLLAMRCSTGTSKAPEGSTKFDQYYIKGESLYLKHCSNCHQKDGSGLGRLYPPLDTSDFMTNNFEEVVCIQRFGREGEIIVNGKQFNMKMSLPVRLSDLEIAQISTYIYNSWTHQRGLIDVSETSLILQKCRRE